MKKALPFIIVLILSSCASLPSLSSTYLMDDEPSLKYRYDIENNLAYKVSHDDDYLYLDLKTDDKASIIKILRQGLFIYMDPNGKKSKEIYFNYPLTQKHEPGSMRKPMGGQSNSRDDVDVNNLLDRLSIEAIYSKYGLAEKMPVYIVDSGFKVEIIAVNKSVMEYKLRIPFRELKAGGLKNISELSIGIMTGKIDMPSSGDRSGGGESGMQGGGRSGGGMQGANSGGGRPDGNMQGAGEHRESMSQQLALWFLVDLSGKEQNK
jgi:hypothetical protein